MQEHLRLHFESEELSDESVLSIYPSTIRRRILRHLYLDYLQRSYLFEGCSQKHLDALLGAARLEVFLPHVDILAAGEVVNELCVVVGGVVEVVPVPADDSDSLQAAAHAPRIVQEGELFGEVAFFTETAQLEAIRSLTVTRVLVISRAAFDSIERSFPIASRTVLDNLRRKAEQAVDAELGHLPEAVYMQLLAAVPAALHPAAAASAAELMDGPDGGPGTLALLAGAQGPLQEETLQIIVQGMTTRQEQAFANLVRVQALVSEHISKLEEEATIQFLYAASRGSTRRVRQMLSQGFDVNRADYDNRTALMLACVKGHASTVKLLLEAGARPEMTDNFGSSALLEACTYGHDATIDILVQHGARLGSDGVEDASLLCTCVYEGNMPKLRRLLRAGLPVNAFDYDRRTATHISAAEGNLTALRLLVEEGGANLGILDRWGHSALDEAERIGANNVVAYLVVRMSRDEEQHAPVAYPVVHGDDDEEPWYGMPRGHASRMWRPVVSSDEEDDKGGPKENQPRRFSPPTGPRYAHPPKREGGNGAGRRLQRHKSGGRRGLASKQQRGNG